MGQYGSDTWNYSQTHYSDVRWCTSKWTLGHRRKKRGGGYNTSSPISLSIFFIPRKFTFLKTISVVFSLSNELNEEYIETSYYIVYTPYTACIGAADPKVFQMLLFFKWFFLWVSQSFLPLNIRHRNFVIYGYFVCVYWSEMSCALLREPPIHEIRYARYVYVNPEEEF